MLALALADAPVVERAIGAASGLAPIEPCRDAGLLARLPAPPVAHREEIRGIREALSHVAVLERADRFEEGLAAIAALRDRADALGWPPLVAAILATEASLREDEGAYDQSERVAASPRTAARVAASVGTS